jgi:hypothetical protein
LIWKGTKHIDVHMPPVFRANRQMCVYKTGGTDR